MISAFFAKINAGIASIGMMVGSLLGLNPDPQIVYVPAEPEYVEEESLGADTVLPIAGAVYYLAGTGISSSASSFTLTSFTIPQNGKKIQDSEMSDTFYVTFEPGNRSRQEIASCTTVTQNVDGTATISGCTRGLSPVTPYTASSSLQFAHGGGSTVIFSNPPQLYNDAAMKGNDEIITGQWTFNVFPISASTSLASATTSGYVELATGGEAASSTLQGDIAGSKLALHTGIATSAAPTSGNVIPVTGDDGNLDYGFLPGLLGSSTLKVYAATTTSWTTIYTKPTSLRYIVLEMVGGGGGGGGGNEATPDRDGNGGGGGGYCRLLLDASALSATTSMTIGEAGAGGANGGGTGATGGSTIFGTIATSTGGTGGTTGFGVGTGAGGTATGCDLNIAGGPGQPAGSDDNASDDDFSGGGGNSVLGGGGVGKVNTTSDGAAGGNYGGGGGGGRSAGSDNARGGNGGPGVIIIREYF